MALTPPGAATPHVGEPGRGLIHGGESGLTALTKDETARTNLWVGRAQDGSGAGRRPGGRAAGAAAVRDGGGLVRAGAGGGTAACCCTRKRSSRAPTAWPTQPVALAAFTDLFVQTALRELPHNHRERLLRPAGVAAPGHLRRAEAFMRAQAEAPIGLAEIAAAAGCSVRTLQNAFRLFRDTTPHRALQTVRLERARAALQRGEEPVAAVARRFGFSHVGRFAASYARQFGERPRRG